MNAPLLNPLLRHLSVLVVVFLVACPPPPPGSETDTGDSFEFVEDQEDTGALGADDTAARPSGADFAATEFAALGTCGDAGTLYDARVNPPGDGSGGTIDCSGSKSCWVRNADDDSWNDDNGTNDTADTGFTAEVPSYDVLYCACPANDCNGAASGSIPSGFEEEWSAGMDLNDCTDTVVGLKPLIATGANAGQVDTGAAAIPGDEINVDAVDTDPYDGIDQDCNSSPSTTVDGGDDEYDADDDGYIQAIHFTAYAAYRTRYDLGNGGNPGPYEYVTCVTAGCGDCDDNEPDVNPGETEVWYDGVDSNCDGANDYDQDGDGQDCDGSIIAACTGHTGTDCLDSGTNADKTKHRTQDGTTWKDSTGCHMDVDGDAYGKETGLPAGVTAGTDCNDGSTSINEGVNESGTPSLVGNSTDENCDDLLSCYTDDDKDGFGIATVKTIAIAAGSCDQDNDTYKASENDDDCADADQTVYPGATQLCDGVNNDCSSASPAWPTLPSGEIDNDADGYVDCKFDGVTKDTWKAGALSGGDRDCLDTTGGLGAKTYPGAPELCDGYHNDCSTWTGNPGWSTSFTSGLTANINNTVIGGQTGWEVDNDDDAYVECTFSSGVTSGNWGNQASENPDVVGGGDCVDTGSALASVTKPRVNGVGGWADTSGCYTDADADGYGRSSTGLPASGLPSGASSGADCNDDTTNGPYQFPNNAEVCDGIDNDCADGVPATEVDNDSDTFVECDRASITWRGGGTAPGGKDCLDTDNTVYPSAPQLCDGVNNVCKADGTLDTLPANETDNDGDGYVDCKFNASSPTITTSTWKDTNASLSGDRDCLDSGTAGATTYPGAPEQCDGYHNDCSTWTGNPGWSTAFTSGLTANINNTVIGGQTGWEVDNDDDTYVECTFSSGVTSGNWGNQASENPDVAGGGDCVDTGSALASVTKPRVNGVGGWADTNGCYTDADADGYGRSSTGLPASGLPAGATSGADCNDDTTNGPYQFPNNAEVCDGIDNDCLSGVPANEVDNDTDAFVECDRTGVTWRGGGTAPGGLDCLDSDNTVKPGATQICDGINNVCKSDGTLDTLPANETDSDGDGYVDCKFNASSPTITTSTWKDTGVTLVGDRDCLDSGTAGPSTYPGAPELCDGYHNNCSTWTGNPGWSTAFTSGLTANINNSVVGGTGSTGREVDNDDDTYVECTFSSGVNTGNWGNAETPAVAAGGDCVDDGALASVTKPRAFNVAGWNDTTGCYTDADGDGYGRSATGLPAAPPAGAASGTDCHDAASSCTNDCSNSDGDSFVDCAGDRCLDADGDNYGVTITDSLIGSATVTVGNCNTGSGACTVVDDACAVGTCVGCGNSTDCNDNPSNNGSNVNPGINENGTQSLVGNTIDEDCDGNLTCFKDDDSDGYGNNATFGASVIREIDDAPGNCDQPALDVANDRTDCDDTRDYRNPGFAEICDGYDNDCSGALLATEFDDDNDGYVECAIHATNALAFPTAGSVPWGNVENPVVVGGGDCNDSTGGQNTFPGAAQNESPGFGGLCMRDTDNDGWGDVTAGGAVIAGTDCSDSDATLFPGAPELCDGKHNDCLQYSGGPAGTPVLPSSEIDDDNDRYVDCDLSVPLAQWANVESPTVLGGGDCFDNPADGTAVHTFPGSSPLEAAPKNGQCLRDADGDNYGDLNPPSGVTAGTDCDDGSATAAVTFPGSAESDSATVCMRDRDGDGWGDSTVSALFTAGRDCVDNPSGLADQRGQNITGATIHPTSTSIQTPMTQTTRSSNEVWYDGVDQNCDGWNDFDQDGDGQKCGLGVSPLDTCPGFADGGTDCMDTPLGLPKENNPAIRVPGSQIFWSGDRLTNETWYDGVDQNCDAYNDYDQDGDGFMCEATGSCAHKAGPSWTGTDCTDTVVGLTSTITSQTIAGADIGPTATETWYDAIDQNCDDQNDFDQDNDTYVHEDFPSRTDADAPNAGDCEDSPGGQGGIAGNLIRPGAADTAYDGVDQNCDNFSDYDWDRDGYDSRAFGGLDCVDNPAGATTTGGSTIAGASIKPGVTETYYNGVDQNCDDLSDYDQDVDGYDCDSQSLIGATLCPGYVGGTDCDDVQPLRRPGVEEYCELGGPFAQVDNDCDGNVNTQAGQYQRDQQILGTNSVARYLDFDKDTFGEQGLVIDGVVVDPSDPYYFCNPNAEPDPLLFVAGNFDCDDQNAQVNPDATERCNGLDDNCNGEKDEPTRSDEPPPGCVPYYIDGDQDGFATNDLTAENICVCSLYAGNPDNKPRDCNPGIELESNFTNVEFEGECWSFNATDCADNASNVHPPTEKDEEGRPVYTEFVDGIDNDCDGRIPLIEIDCDNDGSYALLEIQSGVEPVLGGFKTADQVGLMRCDAEGLDNPPRVSCFGTDINLVCDGGSGSGSGLWMVQTQLLVDAGVFARGRRIGQPDNLCDGWDCDDNCALRCEGQFEVCDGIDNDCADAASLPKKADANGIPDRMERGVTNLGYVVPDELDLDGDNQITCTTGATGQQTGVTERSCTTYELKGDCNDQCYLVKPEGGVEVCNGFVNADDCIAAANEGTNDGDGDRYRMCGAWGSVEAEITDEQFFMLLRVQGSLVPPEEGETIPDELLPNALPLIPARDLADQCDAVLRDELEAIGVTDLFQDGEDFGDQPLWWGKALEDCIVADICRQVDAGTRARPDWIADCTGYADVQCATAALKLTPQADEQLYQQSEDLLGCDPARYPEQLISRTVWSRERILEARRLVVEWDCYRMYGTFGCGGANTAPAPAGYVNPYAGQVVGNGGHVANNVSTTELNYLLTADPRWWKEIARYEPEMVQEGALLGCWGNPTNGVDALRSFDYTGGDCEVGEGDANRDMPEGPDDLVGLYLGEPADCSTCLDGVDNNCNGYIDCADPACARCFVGQGVGCGGGSESACTQSGCNYGSAPGGVPTPGAFGALFSLALAAAGIRRKKGTK